MPPLETFWRLSCRDGPTGEETSLPPWNCVGAEKARSWRGIELLPQKEENPSKSNISVAVLAVASELLSLCQNP
jgi:hypothetical protein